MANTGLSVSDIVNVTVTISPLAAPRRNFGIPLFVGSSDIIDVYERIRQYSTIGQVTDDFGTTLDEYKAAEKFFSQDPRPSLCYIGRWAQTASKGTLHGALLTPSQQVLANFTAITSGAMSTYIDSIPLTVSGLNFASAININGVASTLQTALDALSTGATVVWDSALGRFNVKSGTTGVASTVNYFTAPTAFGYFDFSGNPAPADDITVNGTLVTFVASGATGSQVNIGATLSATLTALAAFLNGSADTNIDDMIYSVVGSKLYCVSKLTGTAGNAYTLAKTSTAITLSGATLSGGTGTDCSTTFGLTLASGASAPVAGVAAETALECATIMDDMSNLWYDLEFVTSTQPSDADHEAVAQFIEAAVPSRIYGYATQDTSSLDVNDNSDLGSAMKALTLARTYGQYSSSTIYAPASLFGRIATVNYEGTKTAITLKFKRQPGVVAERLTKTQASSLQTKRLNVFVHYDNDRDIIQEGVMANGDFIDERIGCDALQNALQVDVWNLLYTSTTKVPQTDEGSELIKAVCKKVCAQFVRNGWGAPGIWNGPPIGQINTGDNLPAGFYVYAPPYSTQSQADREARKSVPIQIAFKLAGAVHFVDVSVVVNR